MNLIDKDALVAEIERIEATSVCEFKSNQSRYAEGSLDVINRIKSFLDTLEVKEGIAEQECTCNEAFNRIIGGNWNLLCPVSKLGLKNGDKVKVIIKAQKGE